MRDIGAYLLLFYLFVGATLNVSSENKQSRSIVKVIKTNMETFQVGIWVQKTVLCSNSDLSLISNLFNMTKLLELSQNFFSPMATTSVACGYDQWFVHRRSVGFESRWGGLWILLHNVSGCLCYQYSPRIFYGSTIFDRCDAVQWWKRMSQSIEIRFPEVGIGSFNQLNVCNKRLRL